MKELRMEKNLLTFDLVKLLIKETFIKEPKIKVRNYKGLTINFCKKPLFLIEYLLINWLRKLRDVKFKK